MNRSNEKGRGAINLQQLQTFYTVLTEGTMTAAAEKLSLAQPAVTQRIRELETTLGVSLLDRRKRPLKPTDKGEVLLYYTKKILNFIQQAEVAVHDTAGELSGELRVGTINSIGLFLVSPIIGFFFEAE